MRISLTKEIEMNFVSLETEHEDLADKGDRDELCQPGDRT